MSEETMQTNVVRINSALSNKPFFVKITDQNTSIDHIFTDAIDTLKNTGRPLEAQSLAQMYKDHQIYNGNKVIQKGDLLKDLANKIQKVGSQTVQVTELDLVTAHKGGIKQTITAQKEVLVCNLCGTKDGVKCHFCDFVVCWGISNVYPWKNIAPHEPWNKIFHVYHVSMSCGNDTHVCPECNRKGSFHQLSEKDQPIFDGLVQIENLRKKAKDFYDTFQKESDTLMTQLTQIDSHFFIM